MYIITVGNMSWDSTQTYWLCLKPYFAPYTNKNLGRCLHRRQSLSKPVDCERPFSSQWSLGSELTMVSGQPLCPHNAITISLDLWNALTQCPTRLEWSARCHALPLSPVDVTGWHMGKHHSLVFMRRFAKWNDMKRAHFLPELTFFPPLLFFFHTPIGLIF